MKLTLVIILSGLVGLVVCMGLVGIGTRLYVIKPPVGETIVYRTDRLPLPCEEVSE
jgi:hypothetical protein